MLKWLAHYLSEYIRFFHVFDYITFRTILSALFSLLITLSLGPRVIRWLSSAQIGQVIREDGPQSHFSKKGTPTMGGVLMLLAIIVSTLCWADLSNLYIWILLLVLLGYGAIGWVDDYRKLILKSPKGITAKQKFFWQAVLALSVAIVLYTIAKTPSETTLLIPFFKNIMIPLGIFYVVLTFFVIVGTSNAVNLTDGLDGLAILPTVLIAAALGVFAYATSHAVFSHYLSLPYIQGGQEVVVFCGAIVGAGLGFLWFNAYPAQIFMGDVGALALGGALGTLAVIVRQEIVLLIMGGIFVAETVSVMLQVASFRTRGKRIFRMAPLHHHFELAGWPEPRVVVRFWIITVVLVLMGLATLKLR